MMATVNDSIRFAIGQCSLGLLLVAISHQGVCAIALNDDAEILAQALHQWFPQAQMNATDTQLQHVLATLLQYVENPRQSIDLPLDIRGSAFQKQVWQALCQIPTGSTASYSDIAQRIGVPKAVRAVAGACAANRLALLIPCHRVVKVNGDISGYRWGVERKAELLRREQVLL